jgi:hypothetical protein
MIVRLMQRDREQCRSRIAWEVRNCDRRKKLCLPPEVSRVRDERNYARTFHVEAHRTGNRMFSTPIISTRLIS